MKSARIGVGVCVGVGGLCAAAFLAGRASVTLGPSASFAVSSSAAQGPAGVRAVALAQPGGDASQPGGDAQPDVPPEVQSMLDANKPGKEHELLARMAGEWTAHMTARMPDGTEVRTDGVMQVSDIFGDGRYLGQEFDGKFMGLDMVGLGVYGYSTMTHEYQYVWFDSLSTHLYYAAGAADGNTITFHGKEPDPTGSGQLIDYRDEMVFVSDTEHTFTRTYVTPDGEMEGFSIRYTKQ